MKTAEARYNILYHGSRAICPKCHGMLAGAPNRKLCIDCGTVFVCVGIGITESELAFKEVVRNEIAKG